MCRINKLKPVFFMLFFFGTTLLIAQQSNWSPVLQSKIKKAVTKVYESEDISFEEVKVAQATEEKAAVKLNNNLFKINSDNEFVGYLYVAQAPSQDELFDYLVLFNPKLEIKKAKVLIYREQHGRQIGSMRWLNQFEGMTTSDRPNLGEEVDGISGATISAKSMTTAVKNLLSSLELAKENGDL